MSQMFCKRAEKPVSPRYRPIPQTTSEQICRRDRCHLREESNTRCNTLFQEYIFSVGSLSGLKHSRSSTSRRGAIHTHKVTAQLSPPPAPRCRRSAEQVGRIDLVIREQSSGLTPWRQPDGAVKSRTSDPTLLCHCTRLLTKTKALG